MHILSQLGRPRRVPGQKSNRKPRIANRHSKRATEAREKPAATPVIHLQYRKALRAPLFLPSLGPQRPVYVSSLGTPYVERTHVAQVQLEPLTQGSSIFLKSPYISVCNFVGCTLKLTLL